MKRLLTSLVVGFGMLFTGSSYALTVYGAGDCSSSQFFIKQEQQFVNEPCSGTYTARVELPDDYQLGTRLELVTGTFGVVTLFYDDKVMAGFWDDQIEYAEMAFDESGGWAYFRFHTSRFDFWGDGTWNMYAEVMDEANYLASGDNWRWSLTPFAVPEPGMLGLLGLAFVGLFATRRNAR